MLCCVADREMEDEWRVCLEEKKELEEIGWSIEMLLGFPVVGPD
jgi:hypothetical protein